MKGSGSVKFQRWCLLAIALAFTLAASAPDEQGNDEVLMANFTKWLIANGVKGLDGPGASLEIVALGEGSFETSTLGPPGRREWGVVACADIGEGSPILHIPERLLVSSVELQAAGEAPYAGPSRNSAWYPYTLLATWLLRERAKGQASFWAPYLAILPPALRLPIFFSTDLLQEFHSEQLASETHSMVGVLETEYELADGAALGGASLEAFKWAVGILLTRCFAPPTSDGSAASSLLVPLADLLNHADFYQATWTHSREGFFMTAVSNAPAGTQLHTHYGFKSALEHLTSYGFVPASNAHDSVRLFTGSHQVAEYYSAHFARTQWGEGDTQWAHYVAAEAVRAVGRAPVLTLVEERVHRGPEWEYEESAGFAAFAHGHVEARLLAAAAAVFLYESKRQEPDYDALASLSLQYGRSGGGLGCHQLAPDNDTLNAALRMAVAVVYQRVQEVLAEGPSSAEEDRNQLAMCARVDDPRLHAECSPWWSTHPVEMEMALKFRIARKELLGGLASRMLETCGTPEGEANNADDFDPNGFEADAGEDAQEGLRDEL